MQPLRRFRFAFALVITLSCLAPLASAHAQTTPAASDRTARNGAIVRAAFDDWANGGNVFRVLAPDITWTIAGSGPVAGTYHGIDDFTERASRPLVSRLAAPLRPVVHNIWAVDDTVFIRFDASSTTTAGHPYNNQFVWIFRMRDGLVVEAEAFLDLIAYQAVIDNNAPRQR
jgi:ketosteroid isomerase-like protein